MPRISTVKNHEDRKAIERDIIKGKSPTVIAKKYGVTIEAINWHRENNLITPQMVTAVKKSEGDHHMDILQELNGLIKKTEKILQKAEDRNQGAQSLAAIRELRSSYALISAIQLELMKAGGLDGEGRGVLTAEELERRESEERFNEEFQEGVKLLLVTEARTWSDLLLKISTRNTDQIPSINYTEEELEQWGVVEVPTPPVEDTKAPLETSRIDQDEPQEEEPMRVRPVEPTYSFDPRTGAKTSGGIRRRDR